MVIRYAFPRRSVGTSETVKFLPDNLLDNYSFCQQDKSKEGANGSAY